MFLGRGLFADYKKNEQTRKGADDCTQRNGPSYAEEMGEDACFQAAERSHASEDQRPYPHDSATHGVGRAGLEKSVYGREKEQHSPAGNSQEKHGKEVV